MPERSLNPLLGQKADGRRTPLARLDMMLLMMMMLSEQLLSLAFVLAIQQQQLDLQFLWKTQIRDENLDSQEFVSKQGATNVLLLLRVEAIESEIPLP